jgi:hypothetical protein
MSIIQEPACSIDLIPEIEEEIWKPIYLYGVKTHFEVSNLGQVRSLFFEPARILKQGIWDGYCKIKLPFNGKHNPKRVHRLVAIAFIPNPLNLPEVNHLFGNKMDNRACVLEWGTKKSNMQHAVEMGLYKPHSFSNKEPKSVIRLLNGCVDKVYPSFRQLNKEYPTTSVIRAIESGKEYKGFTWKVA